MHQPINFDWVFKPSFDQQAIHQEVQDGSYVDIPHSHQKLPLQYADEHAYQFKSTYQKVFRLEDKIDDKHVFIQFDGVAHEADIYLNGHHIGLHQGGYTTFLYEITDFILIDQDNLLTVFVDARSSLDFPPFGHVIDYLTMGGIYREVTIFTRPNIYIKDYLTTTMSIENGVLLKLDYLLSEPFIGHLKLTVKDQNHTLYSSTHKTDKLSGSSIFQIEHLELWHVNHPKLYTLILTLERDDLIYDEVTYTFGFRTVKFQKDGFYLNNEKIKLVGLNRHQDYPYVGYAMPKSAQIKDAEILKHTLNLNLVRTSHYPQSKHFIEACDRLGLLVFEEMPGWQYIGHDDWKKTALEHIKEMIQRDKNNPSIILWGVRINESGDDDTFYTETNNLAHTLDPSRQTAGVRFITHSSILEDVFALNDFIHEGYNIPLRDLKDVTNQKDIPYLVTEHTGHMFPTKSFDTEQRRYEHAKRHMTITNHMLASDDISGSVGWCMHDYYTHIDFGSGDKICYHGVLDMFRNEKPAAFFYQSQQTHTPYLEVSSNFNIGDHNKGFIEDVYIFSNCEVIKVYRNDLYLGELKRDDTLSSLPYPPFKMDWFGDVLERDEKLDHQTASFIKHTYRKLVQYGKDQLDDDILKMNPSDALLKLTYEMYGKYVANWGSKSVQYTFKGYNNQTEVISQTKGNDFQTRFHISLDQESLVIGDTYDVTRITIEAINEHQHRLVYAHDAFQIETDSLLEVIGDHIISLIGGIRSFWVKTKGQCGISCITIKHSDMIHKFEINIQKEQQS